MSLSYGKSFLVFFVFFTAICLEANAAKYVFSTNCKGAYQAAWALKSAESHGFLLLERRENPDNLIPVYLDNLTRFTEIFSSEDKKDFQKYKDEKEARLDKLLSDNKSPWPRFCKAEIYVQSAVLKLKFSDYLGAAYDFNKAYHNLNDCIDDFPGFLPAQKDLLLLKVMVGTVPANYRWMLKILGFSGDQKYAMLRYEVLLNKMQGSPEYNILTNETRIIYAYLNFYILNHGEEAWKQMDAATQDYTTNPVHAFVRGQLALRLKKNDLAMQTFQPHVKNQPPIPYLDYLMGVSKLQHGDKNAAFYFGRYIKEYKGEHYIKDAYLKLGWSFLLIGDMKSFKNAMDLISTYGTTQIEEDKNALKEAANYKLLVPEILRARLFFDGGYFDKAKENISKVNLSSLNADYQKAEYYYRSGRIDDALGNQNTALAEYDIVIATYSSLNNYFAPASCLFAGIIWEKRKNKEKALAYFRKCISYHGYVYKDSFDQKAYAGIKRNE